MTIQLGIGGLPNAFSRSLIDREDLGVHTELLTEGMIDLITGGVITGRRKNLTFQASLRDCCRDTQDV